MGKNVKKAISKFKKISKKRDIYSKENNDNKIEKKNEDKFTSIIENKTNNENKSELEIERENENVMNESDIENLDNYELGNENNLMIKKEAGVHKLKKKMKDVLRNNWKSNKITYFKELLNFILNEYSGSRISGLYSIIFNLPLLRNIKSIYYAGLTLYNYFVDRNKAIASLILLCINNI
jgi:hypothetical protein